MLRGDRLYGRILQGKFLIPDASITYLPCVQVAMKFVVDDFGIHVIEECLLQKLPEIFTPSTVIGLADDIIKAVAAESEESQKERDSCTAKLEILNRALSILRRLDRHNPRAIKALKNANAGSAVKEEEDHSSDSNEEEEEEEL